MVFAIGSLMDPDLPAYNVEAEHYFHLARAALFQHSLVDDPSTNAVQALVCTTLSSVDGWTVLTLLLIVPDVVLLVPGRST